MLRNITSGERPDFTPAQITATLVAGVPIISNLLFVFGVFTISQAQQDALTQSMTWGGILAGLLVGGDAGLRAARNSRDAKIQSAALTPVPPDTGQPPDVVHGTADEETFDDDSLDVVDEPDEPRAVQPSQRET